MPHINKIKKNEMKEIGDFVSLIEEYGHISYGEEKKLTPSFKKILEGIEEISKIVDDYYTYY